MPAGTASRRAASWTLPSACSPPCVLPPRSGRAILHPNRALPRDALAAAGVVAACPLTSSQDPVISSREQTPMSKPSIDLEKFRLRRFVDRLIEMGEVEVHDEPVPLTRSQLDHRGHAKAVLFRKAGPEQVEMVAKTGGNRKRLAAAFGVAEDKLSDEYLKRLANPHRSWSRSRRRRARASDQAHRQGRRSHAAAVPSPARARRQLLHELGDRFRDRSGDRPPQCRLPAPVACATARNAAPTSPRRRT